jgi:hypothetical protein
MTAGDDRARRLAALAELQHRMVTTSPEFLASLRSEETSSGVDLL